MYSSIADGNVHTNPHSAIVATGLIALVDDCIKAQWHQKNGIQMTIPALMKSPLKMNMEYVGPKRLIDEIFNRRTNPSKRTEPTGFRKEAFQRRGKTAPR